MTAEEISPNDAMQMADFRDTHALYYEKAGKFIGLNREGELRFGKKPLKMVDGIWFLEEDGNVGIENIPASQLTLTVIRLWKF